MLTHSFVFLALLLQLASAQQFNGFGKAPAGWTGRAKFSVAKGKAGVGAMQLLVTTDDKVVMLDRVEENPLRHNVKGKSIPYWGAELSLATGKVRGLTMKTNSFCAGGAWLGDGRFASLGGDPYKGEGNFAQDGYQAIRTFTPCDDGKCQIQEDPKRVKMIKKRWYPATIRLSDGSIFIAGGVSDTGPSPMTDEPTFEYFPRKGNNAIYSPFLHNALPWNTFPHAMALPDDRIFMAAGNHAMIYNPKTNSEQLLPNIPNGVQVVYPWGAAGALLPLTPENNYTPTILLCGGTKIKAGDNQDSNVPSSNQCARMDLTPAGIARGWDTSDPMPEQRLMGDFVQTPDGKLVVINGAKTGVAGYYGWKINDKIGYSSADNPAMTPYLYDPIAPAGKRWVSLKTSSRIPRMYHSVASYLPDGRVIVAGSNPNPTVITKDVPYPTEYRIEYLTLPNTAGTRPTFSGQPSKIQYGKKYSMKIKLPAGADPKKVSVVLMDHGFSTHAVNYNMRNVKLVSSVARNGQSITFNGPPNAPIFPLGPAWIYVVNDGVPSKGKKIMLVR